MSEKEIVEIVKDKIREMKPLEKEFADIIEEEFWDLL